MSFSVRLSSRAERDIRDIHGWIAGRSPEGARRWLDALDAALARIGESPDQSSLAPEHDVFDEELRQTLFKTRHGNMYRALFFVHANVIQVVSVRGGGQRPVTSADLLEK